jgi:hypothetical protein
MCVNVLANMSCNKYIEKLIFEHLPHEVARVSMMMLWGFFSPRVVFFLVLSLSVFPFYVPQKKKKNYLQLVNLVLKLSLSLVF